MGLAKRARIANRRDGELTSIARTVAGRGQDPATADFAAEVEEMLARLGSANVELRLYQVDLEGLRPGAARTIAKDMAGPAALWRQTGTNRYLMLFTGAESSGGSYPLARLVRNMEVVAREPGLRGISAEVRDVRRWSHDIVSADYLLYELAAKKPRVLCAA